MTGFNFYHLSRQKPETVDWISRHQNFFIWSNELLNVFSSTFSQFSKKLHAYMFIKLTSDKKIELSRNICVKRNYFLLNCFCGNMICYRI
jgi:hypothetical protein